MNNVQSKGVFFKLAEQYDDPEKIKSLPEILRLMVTREEAIILVSLPGTANEVQERTGKDIHEVKSVLEKCFKNGLVVRTEQEDSNDRYAFPDIYVDTIVSDHRNIALGSRYKEL